MSSRRTKTYVATKNVISIKIILPCMQATYTKARQGFWEGWASMYVWNVFAISQLIFLPCMQATYTEARQGFGEGWASMYFWTFLATDVQFAQDYSLSSSRGNKQNPNRQNPRHQRPNDDVNVFVHCNLQGAERIVLIERRLTNISCTRSNVRLAERNLFLSSETTISI